MDRSARCAGYPPEGSGLARRCGGSSRSGVVGVGLGASQQIYAYADHLDRADLSAALTAGLVRDRPFEDANKRTGFLLGVLFPELNGLEFVAKEEDAAQAVLALAAGTLTETEFKNWLSDNLAGWVKGMAQR